MFTAELMDMMPSLCSRVLISPSWGTLKLGLKTERCLASFTSVLSAV